MPNVYTIGIQWFENIENNRGRLGRTAKTDLEKFLDLITHSIDLADFYQMKNRS